MSEAYIQGRKERQRNAKRKQRMAMRQEMSEAYIQGQKERRRNAQQQRRRDNKQKSQDSTTACEGESAGLSTLRTPLNSSIQNSKKVLGTQTQIPDAVVQSPTQSTDSTKSDVFAANTQQMQVVMNWLNSLLHSAHKSMHLIKQPLLALARGIDFSVANGEVPSTAPDLSLVVKQICDWKSDSLLLPLIMVLMVSVKNACKFGWFSAADTEEITDLYNEVSGNFCLPENIDSGLSSSGPHMQKIMNIMNRYYPRLSLDNIIASFEVKPGYGTYLVDFHISKNVGFSLQEKIRLFVAQTDNTDTSACLISPQQVTFLLNGKGVTGRVNCATMDTGPQIPTNVTALLKFGTNLLQVVGHFSGNYVIAVTFMGVMSLSTPDLQDYVQPGITTQSLDSETDVILGPSHVSLNCPISYERIKTPVGGHSCNHIQCFDFDNFIQINSRRPLWRCPHCNQYISFLDIRRDQNMVKILNEVEDDVQDVIISPDGSWKNGSKTDGHADGSGHTFINHQGSDLRGMNTLGVTSEILDLAMEGDMMYMVQASDPEDRKSSHVDLLNSMLSDVNMQTVVIASNQANQSPVPQVDGLNLQKLGRSDDRFDRQMLTNTFNPAGHAPILTNSMEHGTNQVAGIPNNFSSHGAADVSSQHSQLKNSQYVSVLSSVPATITKPLAAAQPFAATSQTPNSMTSQSQGLSFVPFNADLSTTNYNEVGRHQNYSHSALFQLQRPMSTPHQPQQYSMEVDRDIMQYHNSAAINGSCAALSNCSNLLLQQQQQHQQILHQTLQQQHYLQQTAGMMHTPCSSGSIRTPNIEISHTISQPPRPYQIQPIRQVQAYPCNVSAPGMPVEQVSRTEFLVNNPADSYHRPAVRMRGSLSGQAYEDARNLFISTSTQPTRPIQSPNGNTSPPTKAARDDYKSFSACELRS